MPESILQSLRAEAASLGLDGEQLIALATAALVEDLGGGPDTTSVATVPSDQTSVANFVSRADGVAAGLIVAKTVMAIACEGRVDFSHGLREGSSLEPGSLLLTARGNSQGLLLAERTALNFLCHLSGVATLTRSWVKAIEGTEAKIRDTRKTKIGRAHV